MFFQYFETTFSATVQVILLAAAGYFTVKGRMLDERGLDQMTSVIVNILLPCFAFTQLTQHFNFTDFPDWWHLPLIYVAMALAALALAFVVGFGFKGQRKNEFMALVGFQNSGNIPLVVVAALFSGPDQHRLFVYMVLYIIGANILVWSLGVWLLLQGHKARVELKKIVSPPLVTTVVTMVLVRVGGHEWVPEILLKPVAMLGNCALPLAMFIVGGGLASINLRKIEPGSAAMVILTKMILYPTLALLFVLVFNIKGLMGFLIVLEAAVPSAVTLSLIKRYYNLDEGFVGEGVLVTHLASMVTVPVFLTLYMKLSGQF